jgi:hypothetical protein
VLSSILLHVRRVARTFSSALQGCQSFELLLLSEAWPGPGGGDGDGGLGVREVQSSSKEWRQMEAYQFQFRGGPQSIGPVSITFRNVALHVTVSGFWFFFL